MSKSNYRRIHLGYTTETIDRVLDEINASGMRIVGSPFELGTGDRNYYILVEQSPGAETETRAPVAAAESAGETAAALEANAA